MNQNTSKNLFPEVFRPGVMDSIKNIAKAFNCSIDFIACSILVAVSIAIGSKSKIQIKKAWQEAVILFLIIVGEPGSKKTPAIKIALGPILRIQESFLEEYQQALSTTDTKVDFQKNIITTDATMEAIAPLMAQNPHGILLLKDEAIGWIKSWNQYKSGGDDQEKYLSLFSQTPSIIHRKGSPQIQVNNPFLSFIGGIQVDVLESLSSMKDNGFIERILFCYPEPIPVEHSDFELDEETRLKYDNLIMKIYESQIKSEPKVFTFSPDAQISWNEWHTDFCHRIGDSTTPYYLRSVLSKLEAYTAKFALILEYLKCAELGYEIVSISKESLQGAIMLTDYFTINFVKVRGSFASSAVDKKIQGVVLWMSNNGGTAKARQIYTNRVAGIKTASEVYDVFMEMKARRLGTVFPTNDGHQKSHSFTLHPQFLTNNQNKTI